MADQQMQLWRAHDIARATETQPGGLLPVDTNAAIPPNPFLMPSNRLLTSGENQGQQIGPASVSQTTVAHFDQPFQTSSPLTNRSAIQTQPGYAGGRPHPGMPRNPPQNQNWIPDEENVAFWIDGLPHDIAIREVLAAIRNFGPINASEVFNRGCTPRGAKQNAAAKVVFFTRRDARAFYWSAVENQNLFVRGLRVPVKYSSSKQVEEGLPTRFSRVVFIEGPRNVVNTWYLQREFCRAGYFWESDEVIEHGPAPARGPGPVLPQANNSNSALGLLQRPDRNTVILEWRFSSWRDEAQEAVRLLVHGDAFRGRVRVRYGHDPCGFPEDRVPAAPFPYETEQTVPYYVHVRNDN